MNRATTAVPGPRRWHAFDAEERGVPSQVPSEPLLLRAGTDPLWRRLPGLRTTPLIASGTFGIPSRAFHPAVADGEVLHIWIVDLAGDVLGPTAPALFERAASPMSTVLVLASMALVAFTGPQRQPGVPGLVWVASCAACLLGRDLPLGAEERRSSC